MKSGFQSDNLAQTENSSSQMKVFYGTAENGIQTANHAKYANEIKKPFRVFGVFRGSNSSGQLFLDNRIGSAQSCKQ
jgi:hypothetical protein